MNKIYPGILLTLLATSNYMTKAASLADVFALEDVVVSASKTAEPVKEAPVPVTLISADMIQRSGARNLRDLLAWYVPGMSMVTDHNEYNISMRGVYASSQQKILIMLNGHRLNGRTYSEAFTNKCEPAMDKRQPNAIICSFQTKSFASRIVVVGSIFFEVRPGTIYRIIDIVVASATALKC